MSSIIFSLINGPCIQLRAPGSGSISVLVMIYCDVVKRRYIKLTDYRKSMASIFLGDFEWEMELLVKLILTYNIRQEHGKPVLLE